MSASGSYSPGLEGVVAGETAVSSLDGGLRYRGYAVEELAERASFEEVAYLLLHGEAPRRDALADFAGRVRAALTLPAEIVAVLRSLPRRSSGMDVLRTAASLLGHWDTDAADNSTVANLRKSERLTGQMAAATAAWERIRRGEQVLPPDAELSHAGNVLYLLTGQRPPEHWTAALNVSLILYAEHEFNASTFAARCVASTLSDLHSAITAAIGTLKGPLHGGANERVLEILQEVASPAAAEGWVRRALAEKRRIMGFGHRVYKDGDPRAAIIKPLCERLAAERGLSDLEDIAGTIERIVEQEKGLRPNVDWPTARLYHYLGLPVDLYTPLFVVSRIVGWSAHVTEQLANNRLMRPLAKYVGAPARTWPPLENR